MEKLNVKYNDLLKIHNALNKVIGRYQQALSDKSIDEDTVDERRDSVIQRFEITYELLWKYIQEYISVMRGGAASSPRAIFQQCVTLGLLTAEESQQLIELIEDRNLTTHVYNIDMAKAIAVSIPKHYNGINAIIIKLAPDSIKTE